MIRKRVVVLGASPKEERYSNRAVKMLLEYGHDVVPIHPVAKEIRGLPVASSLAEVAPPIDTVTIYVAPAISTQAAEAILALRPRRIVFNPETENPALEERARTQGIEVLRACTLVLLRTGAF